MTGMEAGEMADGEADGVKRLGKSKLSQWKEIT
jgi:hypothetical protein